MRARRPSSDPFQSLRKIVRTLWVLDAPTDSLRDLTEPPRHGPLSFRYWGSGQRRRGVFGNTVFKLMTIASTNLLASYTEIFTVTTSLSAVLKVSITVGMTFFAWYTRPL